MLLFHQMWSIQSFKHVLGNFMVQAVKAFNHWKVASSMDHCQQDQNNIATAHFESKKCKRILRNEKNIHFKWLAVCHSFCLGSFWILHKVQKWNLNPLHIFHILVCYRWPPLFNVEKGKPCRFGFLND